MAKLLTSIAAAFILLGSGVPSRAAPTKLIVGYAAINARVSPLWIAEEQGYFAKYGLQVEQIYLRGAPTLVAGLASGDIQLGQRRQLGLGDRKSTRLNSSHRMPSRMPSSA